MTKSALAALSPVLASVLFLVSCDTYVAPDTLTSGESAPGAFDKVTFRQGKMHFTDNVDFGGGVTVSFDASQLDGTNTTLCWDVTISETSTTDVTHFAFEDVPSLPAVASLDPSEGSNTPANFGFDAIAFHTNASGPGTRTFCATFDSPPNHNIGVGYVGINTQGGSAQLQLMLGPFARVFGQDDGEDDGGHDLEGGGVHGSTFVDPDQNGVLDEANPARIPNITVELFESTPEGEVMVAEALTDPFGLFEFDKIFDGDYVGTYFVRVRADASDVNADILANFTRTTSDAVLNVDTHFPTAGTPGCPAGGTCPASWDGQAGAFFPSIDFGFYADADVIKARIESGQIITLGKSVRDWLRAYRTALRSADGDIVAGTLTRSDFLDFLSDVEALHFPNPFQFGTGSDDDRIGAAIDLLNANSNDLLTRFKQELLAAELNQVSDFGLEGKDDLLSAITRWAEGVVIKKEEQLAAKPTGDSELESGASMLTAINGGGGGGGTNF